MHITRLELVDFRSHALLELDLSAGVTTFLGSNGRGKTNVVEALGYAATLRSHRVATDAPLVRQGAPRALVRAQVSRGGRPVLIEVEIIPGRANRARVNRTPVARQRDVLGHLTRVIFCPEDLALVKGDPGDRRGFLDDVLVSLSPRFDAVLSDLDRVLRQRNSLLKSASALRGGGSRSREAAERTLSVWDEQLAGLAADLIAARFALVDRLAEPVQRNYRTVADDGRDAHASIAYTCGVPDIIHFDDRSHIAQEVLEALGQRRDEQFARGVTLVGPHRDELTLTLNGLPLRGYASHGECWSMALALRLASFDLLAGAASHEGQPVLVLDDVFSELDAGRRARLAEAIAGVEQVLITAAVIDDVPDALRGRIIPIDSRQESA